MPKSVAMSVGSFADSSGARPMSSAWSETTRKSSGWARRVYRPAEDVTTSPFAKR